MTNARSLLFDAGQISSAQLPFSNQHPPESELARPSPIEPKMSTASVPPSANISGTSQITNPREALPQLQISEAVHDDIRQLEAEQSRLNEAIRESERLMRLREEKERVTKRLEELRQVGAPNPKSP